MNNMILCPKGNPTKSLLYSTCGIGSAHRYASGELAAGSLLCWAGRCECQQYRKWKSAMLQAAVHHPLHLLILS